MLIVLLQFKYTIIEDLKFLCRKYTPTPLRIIFYIQ